MMVWLPVLAIAQPKPLLIEGVAPQFYLTHTVAPKENYYSIGRLYNISPREIAPFNKLELEKGLSLHQVIKIPLTAVNFSQDGAVASDEVLVPLHHVVKEKEGLFRIGQQFNKLPLETLRQWNNLRGDAVSNGTRLIIGYLRVKKELSAFSGMAKEVKPVTTVAPPAKPDISQETLPVVKNPEKKPVEQPAVKKEEPVVVKKDPVPAPAVKKEEPVAVIKNETPVQPVKKEEPRQPVRSKTPGGYFKSLFSDQERGGETVQETGQVAVFKSTSGWEDGKYYCLHNQAVPGTILKITASATGRTVYAKVLDVMPDIRQNNGLLMRLSNAAAAELGVEEGRFDCTVGYAK